MRYAIAVAAVAAGLAGAGAARAGPEKTGSAADAKAVGKLATDWTAAWNQHDAGAMAGVFAATGDMLNPMGDEARGRAEVQKRFEIEQAGHLKQSTMALTCEPARFLAATVAELDCGFVLANPNGPQAPAELRGSITSIAVRGGEGWSIASMRAMIPTTTGAPAAAVTPAALVR